MAGSRLRSSTGCGANKDNVLRFTLYGIDAVHEVPSLPCLLFLCAFFWLIRILFGVSFHFVLFLRVCHELLVYFDVGRGPAERYLASV